MKNVALYIRVSTDEERQNINNQIDPLEKYAQSMSYQISNKYIDYVSGGTSNRPQFQQMLEDVKLHKFDILLVWSLDRFSRESILNTLSYLEILKRNKVAIKSLQESWLDTSDEGIGELLIAIISWVAQQERKRISERVKAGLKKAKNVGKRGKDKKSRKRLGYFKRWNSKK